MIIKILNALSGNGSGDRNIPLIFAARKKINKKPDENIIKIGLNYEKQYGLENDYGENFKDFYATFGFFYSKEYARKIAGKFNA